MNVEAKPGKYVSVGVIDTGFGIPEQNLTKIFDPFFSAKEHGQGTGLGLSTVAGIVRSHGGFVNVYSEIGRGARFKVYLPAIEAAQTAPAKPSRRDRPMGNGELILVIDDESAIREVARETLSAFGYQVMVASDGAEAMAVFAEHKDEVKVVITDMMMPYMDGPATIRALRRLDPKAPIIATSGLKAEDKIADAAQLGAKTFLCLERSRVPAASSFKELGADILDFYSIILDLEVIFRVPIPDSESRRFVTVGDVVIWILDHEQSQRFTTPVFQNKRSDRSTGSDLKAPH